MTSGPRSLCTPHIPTSRDIDTVLLLHGSPAAPNVVPQHDGPLKHGRFVCVLYVGDTCWLRGWGQAQTCGYTRALHGRARPLSVAARGCARLKWKAAHGCARLTTMFFFRKE